MPARNAQPLVYAIVVLLAFVACRDDHAAARPAPALPAARAGAVQQTAPAAPASAPADAQPTQTGPLCASDDEDAALRCAQGSATRRNDSLTIETVTGRLVLVNTPGGESEDGGYQYAGTLRAHGVHHLVRARGYESVDMQLYSRAGATPVTLASLPIPAPGGPYFAASVQGMSMCEGTQSSIEIWHLADSGAVRDWHIEPWDCGRNSGWAPEHVAWTSPDTLRFTHVELAADSLERAQGVQVRHDALVVRKASGWTLVDPAP